MKKQANYLRLSELSRELGVGRKASLKALARLAWMYPPVHRNGATVYDARVLDVMRAMHGQPHRTLEPAESDWLADYLKGHPDASTEANPGPAGRDLRTT